MKGATIVAAHLGGFRYLDDVEKYLVGEDVYLDTSYTIGKASEDQVRRIIGNHRSDRILFGTDSPWEDQGEALTHFKGLPLAPELEHAILYGNAARLLGLASGV